MPYPLAAVRNKNLTRPGFPFTINFDGDETTYFDGGWSEVAGNVLNDQIAKTELLDNPGFEGIYAGAGTLFYAPNWGNMNMDTGVDTAEEELVIIHGGTKSQHIDSDATNEGCVSDSVAVVDNIWHEMSAWVHPVSGTILVIDNAGRVNGTAISAGLGSFEKVIYTQRASSSGVEAMRIVASTGAAEFYADDASLASLSLESILNVLKSQFGLSDGFFIDIYINAVSEGTQVGAIWNYDGSNNFGMAYMDGTDLIVDKNVAGAYSNLASVAQAVTPDQILRIENPAGSNVLDILYNGVSKATPTIADAGIISNTGIALFSTEANNAISKVVIGLL